MSTEKRKILLIFIGVLLASFVFQEAIRSVFGLIDRDAWAEEIKFFLAQDPAQFGSNGAYGHPGGTVIEFGILIHALFNLPYEHAVTVATSIIVALAVAATSVICFILEPDTLWWLATACTLPLNRLYMASTPPTSIAMPLITLIVLTGTWLMLGKTPQRLRFYFGWGALVGFACATRYDISLLVGVPFSLLIAHRQGRWTILPMIAGMLILFCLADPFLWRTPVQHLNGLLQRLTINYAVCVNMPIIAEDIINAVWLSAIACAWSLALLARKRLPHILPAAFILLLCGISFIMLIIIWTSNYKPARYFFPLAAIWETLLPLLVLKKAENSDNLFQQGKWAIGWNRSHSIIAVFCFIQLVHYIALYIFLH